MITNPCNFFSRGGKEGASYDCQDCRGAGVKNIIRKLGSGLIQQMQIQCPDCNGTGLNLFENILRLIFLTFKFSFLPSDFIYIFNESIAGTKIPEKDRCKTCRGEKTLTEKKMLEVVIQRGMHDGQKICFRGEGDQEVLYSLQLKV